MALARPRDTQDLIELRTYGDRSFPGIVLESPANMVPTPAFMAGDHTAFAVYLSDYSLAPVMRPGWILYCSRSRDPSVGDIVFLTLKSGPRIVRILHDLSEDGYEVEHMSTATKGNLTVASDIVPFEDLDEVAVVVGSWRYAV